MSGRGGIGGVVTVGGGFTSMDCVRTVLRMGAEQSIMTYRRSIQEIPVDALELEEAEHEGVELMYMVAQIRVIDDGQGRVAGLELVRNELGLPLGGGQEMYVGADYGHVGGPSTQWQSGDHLAGAAIAWAQRAMAGTGLREGCHRPRGI